MAELPAAGAPEKPGFVQGVTSLPAALQELLQSPGLWLRASVPIVVSFFLFVASAALGLLVARPWLETLVPEPTTTLERFGVEVADYGIIFVVVAAILVGWYVSLALVPPLSAPALESLVGEIETRVGAPPRAPLGFLRELACGFRALCGAAVVAIPSFFVLWLVGVLLPILSPLTYALGSTLSSLLIAWGLFDYPLTLRGVGFRARLTLVRENFACVLGFGLAFAFGFWLCCGIAVLPVGVIAATRLLAGILGWNQASLRS